MTYPVVHEDASTELGEATVEWGSSPNSDKVSTGTGHIWNLVEKAYNNM